jgi:excisionase family DNA binding protein
MPATLRSATDPKDFARSVHEAVANGAELRLQVGDDTCTVNGPAATAILVALRGEPVDALPDELTTGQAADLLGVSRPTVVSLIDRGLLAATRVGTHRRVRTSDVLTYRQEARNERRAALDDLAQLSEELGLYDADA